MNKNNIVADHICLMIEDDITDRRGLKDEWESIDADVKREIREDWKEIFLNLLNKDPATDPIFTQRKSNLNLLIEKSHEVEKLLREQSLTAEEKDRLINFGKEPTKSLDLQISKIAEKLGWKVEADGSSDDEEYVQNYLEEVMRLKQKAQNELDQAL